MTALLWLMAGAAYGGLGLQRYDNHGHDEKRSWPCWQKVEDFPVYDQYAQAANY